MAWNDEAVIECRLTFRCPRTWGQLTPTKTEGVRHCSECERDVRLALTAEDFRRHAEEGQCVAVRVLQRGASADDSEEVYAVGSPNGSLPYAHLTLVEKE